ncbi:glycosyltransferase [Candidatus Peregrinibacteria bacterium]|nr:glycosyltransferase [Candidatus Peregrinibacteria bacterium]
MRIGVDIRETFGEKAGKGWYTLNLLKNILKVDNQNEYILYSSQPNSFFEKYKNVRLKCIKAKGLFWHVKARKDIRKQNLDIYFSPVSYVIPAFIPKNTKSIFTVHDLVAFLFPWGHNKRAVLIEKFLLGKALKKATKVCCVSKNTKNDLLQEYKGTEKNLFRIISCAADNNFRKTSGEKILKNIPQKFFLSVGTIIPRKNYVNLIKAFSIAKESLPDHKLIIIGKKGWSYKKVFNTAYSSGLKEDVIFLDYVKGSDLIKYYNTAEAFVFTSLYEGFGIPPLEAMKCGCPVISSHISSMKEVVGQAGLIIDPKNINDVASAMIKLSKNKKLRDKLIKRGFAQSKKFNWEKSAKKMLNIFKEIQN